MSVPILKMKPTTSITTRNMDSLYRKIICSLRDSCLRSIKPVCHGSRFLKKAENFRRAYDNFDVDKIASYDERDVTRLFSDAGIIRNRLKINAAIENAKRIQAVHGEYNSFQGWLDAHQSFTLDEWTRLFKKTFVFTGGEIVREFLVSTGYLAGAHEVTCPIYKTVAALHPAWMRKD